MVIDIKMCRFENVPWGFSLVGGADFEYPLTVVKVTEGSIAEEAGMLVGDVIVRINDTPALPLTHEESNRILLGCGSVFFLGVQRENEEEYLTPKCFPTASFSSGITVPKTFLDVTAQPPVPPIIIEQHIDNEEARAYNGQHDFVPMQEEPSMYNNESQQQYVGELEERPCSVLSEETERQLVEEEIAAVLSGQSEVLPEHQTLGLFPKPGVCMSSDVLRTLNEEATKTKLEKEKENRRWTTFLQKPDRPIPKSKAQLDAEMRKANAYKVKIVKSAPRTERSVSPAPPPPQPEPAKEPTPPVEPEPVPEPEPEPEAPTPVDTEVPNLEETPADERNHGDAAEIAEQLEIEKSDKEKESTPESKETEDEENQPTEENPADAAATAVETAAVVVEKTEEELALERQLADVQRQLAALSSLPSTIQTTLDAVTRQLADLLPSFKLQEAKLKSPEAREISLEKIDENSNKEQDNEDDDKSTDIKQNDNEAENCHESVAKKNANASSHQQREEQDNKASEQIANDTNEARDTIDKNPIKQQEAPGAPATARTVSCMRTTDEVPEMDEEQKLKKQKIELWNRLFNGENIPRLVFRVNFMKYQKPEKKIDLDRSEVYKIIHHLDRQPKRGIEVRAPVVPSEADIREAAQS